jgi:type I site-specific deoxyribonuclease, hsdR family
MEKTTPIAETASYIVLDKYEAQPKTAQGYQSEAALEREFIEDLCRQGYEYAQHIKDPEALLRNVRLQLEHLNEMQFTDAEWQRFCLEYLDSPSDSFTEKARKVHVADCHDFRFDDGHMQNIRLFDRERPSRNRLQVINQMEQTGSSANRYDVTILVNGLPLVHVELKRRGVAIREAFNQIHRYSKESFNSDTSLYKYVQLFVISNGTDTRYFANTTKRDKSSFDFTMNWARADNSPIKDLKDFTATFFQKRTLLEVLLTYSVLDVDGRLLVMRPYQIAATERILWKIRSSYEAKRWSRPEGGGFIWHTTGSGKTLTSFKAAQLATRLDFIDKVFFVVDRKDLDYQTLKEYRRFDEHSVSGTIDTKGLQDCIARHDSKIIVTTLQKLTILLKKCPDLSVYDQQVVFIFDEAHRSQFGEGQRMLRKRFKHYYQFGFTGTPIFVTNALGDETTTSVFGEQLHHYIITDAIRDEKVLKFKVDYNNVCPRLKAVEQEQDEVVLSGADYRKALLHPERIREVTAHILDRYPQKTHRTLGSREGFNAMFAVSSVEAAKLYYEELKRQQAGRAHPLRVATIFSFAPNEEQSAQGELSDESLEPSAMDQSSKEFLASAIADYNQLFSTNFSLDGASFQNYYQDIARRVRAREVDLLIVVGMFLTGFDAPCLNTLFVDKNLRYHGLIQAFSRTNRIYGSTKTFGNIVCFRDLEQATIDAITLFGNQNTRSVILEHPFGDYLDGYHDDATGKDFKGYAEVVSELRERFPDPVSIETDADKFAFVKLFGEYLRLDNTLQNYDEYTALRELQTLPSDDLEAQAALQAKYDLSDEAMERLRSQEVISVRDDQDYRSAYNDIRDWIRHGREPKEQEESQLDWDQITFEVDLLKSQEINLDYILELVFEYNKRHGDKKMLIDEIRRIIRSSIEHRAKEELMVSFIQQLDLKGLTDQATLLADFYHYAQECQRRELATLIAEENLQEEAAKRYIQHSLIRGYASENGTDLHKTLPKMGILNPNYLPKKSRVLERIRAFVDKYKGIGGDL